MARWWVGAARWWGGRREARGRRRGVMWRLTGQSLCRAGELCEAGRGYPTGAEPDRCAEAGEAPRGDVAATLRERTGARGCGVSQGAGSAFGEGRREREVPGGRGCLCGGVGAG